MEPDALDLLFDYLREELEYDPETGNFIRLRGHHGVKVGEVAGYEKRRRNLSRVKIVINIKGKSYAAHNLAWFYMTGEWPEETVDHIDRNPWNNKWENLRLATHQEQNRNVGLRGDNESGYKGVQWSRTSKKWRARIKADGRRIHLGMFKDMEQAARAYDEAAKQHFGEFAKTNY